VNNLAALRALLATPELPELGPGPRKGVKPLAELNRDLDRVFAEAKLPTQRQNLVRAAVLLWHDHHDASHAISQGIETPDGSLLHGILHRREPDYWNAKYWFRRVGKHRAYPEVARRVTEFLTAQGEMKLASQLAPGGQWDAFAMVDACEEAAKLPTTDPKKKLLREIQRIELEEVLEYLLGA
jgi:hypothetical protein